jgi:hypothetical protein
LEMSVVEGGLRWVIMAMEVAAAPELWLSWSYL